MEAAELRRSGVGLARAHGVELVMLTVWAFTPLTLLVINVVRHGGTLTGANGFDPYDQMQYTAWIRDAGSHLLASDLWQVGPTAHDYLHPMYVISGLLWRAGLSLQLAYLIWKPVAVIVLFAGCALYVRHLLPARRGPRAAALLLALFYLTPALQIADWTGTLSAVQRLQLLVPTNDADSALNLWGIEHAAIMIGLMPVFLIAAERILAAEDRPARRWIVMAAVAGMLVSWLRPWQGVMLLAIPAMMFVLVGPRRRYLRLVIPLAATLLPILYGEALTKFDPVWSAFQMRTLNGNTGPWWVLAAGFGPLVVLAALGVRRPRDDRTWMLLLWPVSAVGVYFLVPQVPQHAFTGVTLPLSVLAVSGWDRARTALRIPRAAAAVLAVAAIAVFTIPGAINQFNTAEAYRANTLAGAIDRQLVILTPDQSAALSYLNRVHERGAVLAPLLLSMSIPGLTGREVYAGHLMWQPPANDQQDGAFYSASLDDPTGAVRRRILAHSGARFVISDCGAPASLARAITPVTRPVAHFGCVTVFRYVGAG